jgi:hypothetical protein
MDDGNRVKSGSSFRDGDDEQEEGVVFGGCQTEHKM